MNPVKFDEVNSFFGPPPGFSEDQCSTLLVWKGTQHSSMGDQHEIVSCWEFTEEEWEEVQKTRKVFLGIVGYGMQPVYLTGIKPEMK